MRSPLPVLSLSLLAVTIVATSAQTDFVSPQSELLSRSTARDVQGTDDDRAQRPPTIRPPRPQRPPQPDSHVGPFATNGLNGGSSSSSPAVGADADDIGGGDASSANGQPASGLNVVDVTPNLSLATSYNGADQAYAHAPQEGVQSASPHARSVSYHRKRRMPAYRKPQSTFRPDMVESFGLPGKNSNTGRGEIDG